MSSKRHESAMSRVMNSGVDVKYGALLHQKSCPGWQLFLLPGGRAEKYTYQAVA